MAVFVAGVSACTFSHGNATVTVDASYVHPDGSNVVLYQPPGAFEVDVSATVSDPDGAVASLGSLRASLAIDDREVIPGAITSAIVSMAPSKTPMGNSVTFSGGAQLAWPKGGTVPVRILVAGAAAPFELAVAIAVPQLGFKRTTGSQDGTTASIPMCVVSSLTSGMVAIHLEQAKFMGGTDTDRTLALTAGDCRLASTTPVPAGAVSEAIQSHAQFTVITGASPFIASALVAGASMAPPIAAIAPQTLEAPAIVTPVVALSFDAPANRTAIPAGREVALEVHARDVRTPAASDLPRVSLTFQTSPAIPIVPSVVTTGDDGTATATFAMPDLGGGGLAIAAVAATASTTIFLTN
jgi:hypothetical protein